MLSKMFPKISSPLAKAIRTSEGVIVWVSNLALAAGALIDPSKLPPKEAAIVGGALTVAHVVSRTLLKVTAIQQGVGIGAPIAFEPMPSALAGEADQLLAQGVKDAGSLFPAAGGGAPPAASTQAQAPAAEGSQGFAGSGV